MFLLFISETALAKIPGLSAAGANLDALPYTAPADADMLFYDRPKVAPSLPFDPFGHPSPALVTRASLLEAGFDAATVRVRMPDSPRLSACRRSARILVAICASRRRFPAMKRLRGALRSWPRGLDKNIKQVVLAESVPGGTTTALLVLRALGHVGTVSSAGPENPPSLKEQIWRDTAKRLGIKEGGMKGLGLKAAAELGDPMQVAVAAYAAALPDEVKVTLAGGTQMMAVAALLRDMGVERDIAGGDDEICPHRSNQLP